MNLDITSLLRFIPPLLLLFLKPILSNSKDDEKELSEKIESFKLIFGKSIQFEVTKIIGTEFTNIRDTIRKYRDEGKMYEPQDLKGEEILIDQINNYIFSNRGALKIKNDVESTYKHAKRFMRLFEYIVIIIPFISVGSLFIIWYVFEDKLSLSLYIGIMLLSIMIVLIMWCFKIYKKHHFFKKCEDADNY